MSSNSIDTLVERFWREHVLPRADAISASGKDALQRPLSTSTWRVPELRASGDSVWSRLAEAEPADAARMLGELWQERPELLPLVAPLCELIAQLASLTEDERTELSSSLYVMF
jgi:hypothetical protein